MIGDIASERRSSGADVLFLLLLSVLAVAPFLPGLGFYTDDWAFLAISANAPDQSLGGTYRALLPQDRMRPVAWLYRAALYRAFGLEPLPYHVVNTLVLAGCAILFYLVLRELGTPRLYAVAAPTFWAVAPHYTALRFWYGGGFNASLAIALYLLSLYADLKGPASGGARRFGWAALSLLSLVASVLAYEIAVPLFLLNAFLVWRRSRSFSAVPWANLAALAGLVAYKLATSERFGTGGDVPGFAAGLLRTLVAWDYPPGISGLNLRAGVAVNFGDYGVSLPATAARLASRFPSLAAVCVAAACAVATLLYLVRLSRSAGTATPERRTAARLLGAGLVVFALGYSIFLTNRNIQLSPTGVGNRTAAASSLGAAMAITGALAWLGGTPRREAVARRLFAVLLAAWVAAGALVTATLATFWTRAWRQERLVLDDVRKRFPKLVPGSTLLLDGVCRYVGPAPVFEAAWDLAGALQLYYRDPTLSADVVNPTLEVRDDAVYTFEYDWQSRYPYGPNVFVYHPGRREVRGFPDARAARKYFSEVNPDRTGGCPPGWGGWGEVLF
ncbi:MAG: hypothetical protein ABI610_07140 [Acidobacteriota bacterium]